MNRSQWIRRLRKELKNYPSHIVDEIIQDYQEHFENGIYMGKSEEEIARELGNPKEVAKEYLGEYNTSVFKKFKSLKITRIIYLLIFIIGLITIFPYAVKITSSLFKGLLLFILFVVLVGFIVGGILVFFINRKWNDSIGHFTFTSSFKTSDDNVYQFKQHSSTKIKTIVVDSFIGDVEIKQAQTNQIQATFEGYSTLEIKDLSMEASNDTLFIEVGKNSQIVINKENKANLKLTVVIPDNSDFSLVVKSKLGNVVVYDSYSSLEVDAKLGNIKIYSIQEKVNISASMGNIKFFNFDGYGTIKNSMGNITFEDSNHLSATIEAKVSMGSVKVLSPRLSLIKLSHNMYRIEGSHPNKLIEIKSSMGNIKIK